MEAHQMGLKETPRTNAVKLTNHTQLVNAGLTVCVHKSKRTYMFLKEVANHFTYMFVGFHCIYLK